MGSVEYRLGLLLLGAVLLVCLLFLSMSRSFLFRHFFTSSMP
jgi:hypothetical protein